MAATPADQRSLCAALDRLAVADAAHRYGESIDRRDSAGLRAVLADDVRAQYGNREPIVGADALVSWIDEATRGCLWQHHFLSVSSVVVTGDEAKALVYHTSHRVLADNPECVLVLVGRYEDEFRRRNEVWEISSLVLEVLGREAHRSQWYLAEVGGPGPSLW
jgi:hypothetical protein